MGVQEPVAGGDISAPRVPGLRERKKAQAMRRIQATAMELFLEHGFESVTIEKVAEVAEVSPRTVYRYFGTKEGLVLHDEYDDRVSDALGHFLREGLSPLEAAEAVLAVVEDAHFVADEAATAERTRLFFENPTLRSAGYLLVDEKVDELASTLMSDGGMSLVRARALTAAIVWSVVGALKTWHESGGGPMGPYIREAVAALRDARA